ncbi:MAG: transporter substrate-binding domain-containing protein [Myxococcales bacterium]|nr:transporter substrate-binding domain-containing protein [Myxococcales bacterium]HIK83498.1 transporter substrate-binding domain-containing protein [Myxococcales bacterium]
MANLFGHPVKLAGTKTTYAIAFWFFVLFLGCGIQPIGSGDPESMAPRGTLRVGTSGDYDPFSRWPKSQTRPAGFSIAVAEAYSGARAMDLQWVRFRWPELAADLGDNAFDFALSGVTVRPDRSRLGRFSLPLTTSGAVALVLENSTVGSSQDLNQPTRRLAVNAGGHLERVARRLFSRTTIVAIPDNQSVLEELTEGRVDAVLTDSLEAPHWQRQAKIPLRAIGPLTRDRKAAWFAPSKILEAKRFNRWLLRAEASGELEALRERFQLSAGRTASPLSALLSSLDERLTLMDGVADAKEALEIEIEDIAREKRVLDAAIAGVLREAESAGIAPPPRPSIRRLFQSQIEAAKWIQERRRRQRQLEASDTNLDGREQARSQLEKVIRPALIFLGDRISMLVIACVDTSVTTVTLDDVAIALDRHDLPPDHLKNIHEAITDIIQSEK